MTNWDNWDRTKNKKFFFNRRFGFTFSHDVSRQLCAPSSDGQSKRHGKKVKPNRRLTRSLPRDVYIRRQNDHPGGQGRIYTSHLNFVSTHLSKPGHRRGCCCMSPRCLLRQFVDRCLLFWAFFIEKTVLLCFARFLSKWRETALWLFPDATSWYELYVWWLSLRRRSRRELSWYRLVESEGYEWRWIFAGRGN